MWKGCERSWFLKHGIELSHSIATIFGGKGIWDGLGKTVKRAVDDWVGAGKFSVNFCIHAAIVGAMKARSPSKAPYGLEVGVDGVKTLIDDKNDCAADKYFYAVLAKDMAEQTSMEATISDWKERYTTLPFDLDVILAPTSTVDYKTINGSATHFHWLGRGQQTNKINYCRRRCGCAPCWVCDPNEPLGEGCECPQMRGKWKTGDIVKDGGGETAITKSMAAATKEWRESWKRGTYLAWNRGKGIPTQEMRRRCYGLCCVVSKIKKADKALKAAGVHEKVRKGGYYVMVQDLSVVSESGRKWKLEKGAKQQRCNVAIFVETEDPIKVTEVRGGCVQVDVEDHDNLMGLYAQSLGE